MKTLENSGKTLENSGKTRRTIEKTRENGRTTLKKHRKTTGKPQNILEKHWEKQWEDDNNYSLITPRTRFITNQSINL